MKLRVSQIPFWTNALERNETFFVVAGFAILSLLLLPFFSALAIAAILLLAVRQIRKRLTLKPPLQRKLIITSLVCSLGVATTALSVLIFQIVITVSFLSAADARAHVQSRLSAVLKPFKAIIRDGLTGFLPRNQAARLIDDKSAEWSANLVEGIANSAVKFLFATPDILLALSVFCFAFYWMFHSYRHVKSRSILLLPTGQNREKVATLWQIAEESAYVAIVSTVLVAAVQGSIVGMAAAFTTGGTGTWPVYLVAGFICAFFPVVGLLPVVFVGTLHAGAENGFGAGLTFLGIGCFASLADNFLRALFMSREAEKIGSLLSFFALIGAIYIFGVSGLIVGPFLIAFAGAALSESERIALRKEPHEKGEAPPVEEINRST